MKLLVTLRPHVEPLNEDDPPAIATWSFEIEDHAVHYLWSLRDRHVYHLAQLGLIVEPKPEMVFEGPDMLKLLKHINRTVPYNHLVAPQKALKDIYSDPDISLNETILSMWLKSNVAPSYNRMFAKKEETPNT